MHFLFGPSFLSDFRDHSHVQNQHRNDVMSGSTVSSFLHYLVLRFVCPLSSVLDFFMQPSLEATA